MATMILERLHINEAVAPQLFRMLRQRIVSGELIPGTRLSEAEIASAYDTSRQPVREAFIKLAQASLIEVRPQRGSFVRHIDIPTVTSAQFIREAVECDIVRRVAPEAGPAELRDLDEILARQAEAVRLDSPDAFMASDEDFHRRLAEIAGLGVAWDMLRPLKTQMDRVRHLSAIQFPREILVQQHSDIVAAIRQRDEAGADRHMRHHLRRILQDLPSVVAERPEYFSQGHGRAPAPRHASTNGATVSARGYRQT